MFCGCDAFNLMKKTISHMNMQNERNSRIILSPKESLFSPRILVNTAFFAATDSKGCISRFAYISFLALRTKLMRLSEAHHVRVSY